MIQKYTTEGDTGGSEFEDWMIIKIHNKETGVLNQNGLWVVRHKANKFLLTDCMSWWKWPVPGWEGMTELLSNYFNDDQGIISAHESSLVPRLGVVSCFGLILDDNQTGNSEQITRKRESEYAGKMLKCRALCGCWMSSCAEGAENIIAFLHANFRNVSKWSS